MADLTRIGQSHGPSENPPDPQMSRRKKESTSPFGWLTSKGNPSDKRKKRHQEHRGCDKSERHSQMVWTKRPNDVCGLTRLQVPAKKSWVIIDRRIMDTTLAHQTHVVNKLQTRLDSQSCISMILQAPKKKKTVPLARLWLALWTLSPVEAFDFS